MRAIEESANRASLGANFAFLCDKVGAGKSLCALALIQQHKEVPSVDKNKCLHRANSLSYKPRGFSHDPAQEIQTNLIVVPHQTFEQWRAYIDTQTSLKYIAIGQKRNLADADLSTDALNLLDVVLLKSTQYHDFVHKLYNTRSISPDLATYTSDAINSSHHPTYAAVMDLRTDIGVQ